MARKIPGLQRVLDAPALFSVAYGEIASSIYIALGIIALHALGLTPEVLALFAANPFPDAPPRYVRAVVWEYHFSEPGNPEHAWWRREWRGDYAPAVSRR